MSTPQKSIDLLALCRRVLSEWQYQCPYFTHKKLVSIIPKMVIKRSKKVRVRDRSEPTTADEADDEDNEDDEEMSTTDNYEVPTSSFARRFNLSSTNSHNHRTPVYYVGYSVLDPPETSITTYKNFFDHYLPKLQLDYADLETLYWGIRFRCVPMASRFFCYAIVISVRRLKDLGYAWVLLPDGTSAPICNLWIRNFSIYPQRPQQLIKIFDESNPDDLIQLHTESGPRELAKTKHAVIVVKGLNGGRYAIDPTSAEFQMPVLKQVQVRDPLARTHRLKIIKAHDEKLKEKLGRDSEPGSRLIFHGSWASYIKYLQNASLLGSPATGSKSKHRAKKLLNWRRKNPVFEDLFTDSELQEFEFILHYTRDKHNERCYITSLNLTIASVVTNFQDGCCTYCGETEREADKGIDGYGGTAHVELYKCGRCKAARYCDVECQKADLARHQLQCISHRKRKLN